jgi:hypothetical protein
VHTDIQQHLDWLDQQINTLIQTINQHIDSQRFRASCLF